MCEFFRVPENMKLVTPAIFVGTDYFIKDNITSRKIREAIDKYLPTGVQIPWEETEKLKERSKSSIKDRFEKMGALTVLSAGLIDGVNPCAIATIVFFVAFLFL